jgi:hypothetical protein
MTTTDFEHRCVRCGKRQEAATAIYDKNAVPSDGDMALCSNCGGWIIFDSSREDGTRLPTPKEMREIRADSRCQKAQLAWLLVKRQRKLQ